MSGRERQQPPGKAAAAETNGLGQDTAYASDVAMTSESPDADSVYFELRTAVEHLPFDVLAEMVCGGYWCGDDFPCPRCQRGSAAPRCSAHGDAFRWRCLLCGECGNRRDLERLLLADIDTTADAAYLLASIKAVTA